jgi:3-dehydroquinate dehydratase-2
MKTILLLNGPNLNRLGKREPGIYGTSTLRDVEESVKSSAIAQGYEVISHQSNHEGELIDMLYEAEDQEWVGVIFNPGAYTHYSYALRDAIASISIPVVEIHISNVHHREEFRHHSVMSPVTIAQIIGFGSYGYLLALNGLLHYIKGENKHA